MSALPSFGPLLPTHSLVERIQRIWNLQLFEARIVDTDEEAEAINLAEEAAACERADRDEMLRDATTVNWSTP